MQWEGGYGPWAAAQKEANGDELQGGGGAWAREGKEGRSEQAEPDSCPPFLNAETEAQGGRAAVRGGAGT